MEQYLQSKQDGKVLRPIDVAQMGGRRNFLPVSHTMQGHRHCRDTPAEGSGPCAHVGNECCDGCLPCQSPGTQNVVDRGARLLQLLTFSRWLVWRRVDGVCPFARAQGRGINAQAWSHHVNGGSGFASVLSSHRAGAGAAAMRPSSTARSRAGSTPRP